MSIWDTLFTHPKPLVGALTLPPLPGTPGWFGLLDFWSHRLEQEALALRSAGTDGLLLQIRPEVQGTLEPLPAEAWSTLAVWLNRLQVLCECPLGLALAPNQLTPIPWLAQAGLVQWVRLWVGAGTRLTPLGWMNSIPMAQWPKLPLWLDDVTDSIQPALATTRLKQRIASQSEALTTVGWVQTDPSAQMAEVSGGWLEVENCLLETVLTLYQQEGCEGLILGDTLRKPAADSKGLTHRWPSPIPVETIDPLLVEQWVDKLRGRKQDAIYPRSKTS